MKLFLEKPLPVASKFGAGPCSVLFRQHSVFELDRFDRSVGEQLDPNEAGSSIGAARQPAAG